MFAFKRKFKMAQMVLGIMVLSLSMFAGSEAAAKDVKIGFINLHKAITQTKEFKKAKLKFQVEVKKQQSIIQERQTQLEGMLKEINKQGFVLSPELKKKKEENFLKEKKEFERYVQDQQEQFARKEKGLLEKLTKKMLEVLKQLGKQKKLTMVVELKTLLYSDSALDLTSLATKTYDRLYPQ